MKAIETSYKGYRFRSRLEARWAVFFDAMGIQWQYEPEGYDLNGVYYLPDFYLPQFNMWAEVKAKELSRKELVKVRQLAKQSRRDVLLLIGAPDFINYDAIEYDPWNDDYFRIDYTLVIKDGRFPGGNYIPSGQEYCYPYNYYLSVMAARAARFEHGENNDRHPSNQTGNRPATTNVQVHVT